MVVPCSFQTQMGTPFGAMSVGEASSIATVLLAAGKPRMLPVAIVENATLPDQRIRYTTLAALPKLADDEIAGPALILFGPQFWARESVAADDLAPPYNDNQLKAAG